MVDKKFQAHASPIKNSQCFHTEHTLNAATINCKIITMSDDGHITNDVLSILFSICQKLLYVQNCIASLTFILILVL